MQSLSFHIHAYILCLFVRLYTEGTVLCFNMNYSCAVKRILYKDL